MKVKAFKMVTGEDVICRVVQEKSITLDGPVTEYVVSKPFVLHLQPTQNGMAMGLAPWTLANPGMDNLTVSASSIIVIYDVEKNFENQYLSQTSGIDLTVPGRRL